MSEKLFKSIIEKTLKLVNEEFEKLRLKKISRENIFIFFKEATVGLALEVDCRKSRKDILNIRMVKIANAIQEEYSIPGFVLRVINQEDPDPCS